MIDCADPPGLAEFWGALLDMPRRVEELPDRIVIARSDGSLPMIAVQRVADYHPPRWPDPYYPAQMHFDIGFDDRAPKERLALDLGAACLPRAVVASPCTRTRPATRSAFATRANKPSRMGGRFTYKRARR